MENLSKNNKKFRYLVAFLITLFLLLNSSKSYATITDTTTDDDPVPLSFDLTVSTDSDGKDVVSSLQILFILTIIALAPSILIMFTSFTRVVVVLHFVRSGLGTQQTPPNQIIIGLALFISLFIMSPTLVRINEEALKPYSAGDINQKEAIELGMEPLRDFMLKQVNDKDLLFFIDVSQVGDVEDYDSIPTTTLIPAFIISELRAAFIIGFVIYIPFIVIDMIVASTLMSMGMMMLPPVMISMPFKLLLFILADGWSLVIGELIKSFRL